MYEAVFFDLDGTLIDTESLALRAGMAAFAEAGHPVEVDFLHQLVGRDQPTADAMIRAARPDLPLDRVNALWRAGFAAEMAGGLPLKPGAADLLARLGGRHLALVTSSERDAAHHKLGLAGIAGHFAQVVTRNDVTAPKPAPDPYLLAAAQAGVDPARCLVFEDSETGAASAHAAGCIVVQVPDVLPASGRYAHHIAADLLTGARAAGLI